MEQNKKTWLDVLHRTSSCWDVHFWAGPSVHVQHVEQMLVTALKGKLHLETRSWFLAQCSNITNVWGVQKLVSTSAHVHAEQLVSWVCCGFSVSSEFRCFHAGEELRTVPLSEQNKTSRCFCLLGCQRQWLASCELSASIVHGRKKRKAHVALRLVNVEVYYYQLHWPPNPLICAFLCRRTGRQEVCSAVWVCLQFGRQHPVLCIVRKEKRWSFFWGGFCGVSCR